MKLSFMFMLMVVVCLMQIGDSKLIGHQKNPFFEILENSKVTLFPSPQFSSKKCSSEWTPNGSYCEEKSLVQFAKKDSQVILDSTNKLESQLKTIAQIFKRSFELADLATGKKIHGNSYMAKYIKALSDESVRKFRNLVSLLGNSVETYKRIDSCWADMSRLRSNSLCSICSGRSQVFFASERAIIEDETCHHLIDSCHRFFVVVVNLVTGIDTLIDCFRETKPQKRLSEEIELWDKITETIKKNELKISFSKFIEEKDLSKRQVIASGLCAKLVRIGSRSFVQDFSELLEMYTFDLLVEITQEMEQEFGREENHHKGPAVRSTSETGVNWEPGMNSLRRRLTLKPQTIYSKIDRNQQLVIHSLFEGDVKTIESIRKENPNLAKDLIPMNDELEFP